MPLTTYKNLIKDIVFIIFLDFTRPAYFSLVMILGFILLFQDIPRANAEDIPLRILFTNNVSGELESCG
jgi:hypothetical protein